MQMPRIHISIHLDTKYPIEDVQTFILEECFEGCFTPLYYYDPNKLGYEIQYLDYNNRIKASVLKKDLSLPKDIIFGDIYSKDILAGSFLLNSISKNEDLTVVDFLLPKLKDEGGKLIIDWSELDPSIKVQVHYSEWKNSATYYIGIDVSQGLWGMRHKWLNAMHYVLSEQSKSIILAEEWNIDIDLIDSLRVQSELYAQIEENEFDFEKVRRNIWNTAHTIQERFSSSEKSTIVSPELGKRTYRPVDLPVYYLKKLPEKPLIIPDEDWIAMAWYECFDWNAPEVINNRTMSYWASHPSEEKFIETITYPKLGWKGTWPAIIETITRRPETPTMIHQLLGWIADPNWPGADIAWNHIYKLGKKIIPFIDEAIVKARECDDDWWEEILRELKEDIIEKYNK